MRKNLEPRFWGPGAWKFLHDCVYAVDETSREAYNNMLALLPDILPCSKCRKHAREYITEHPPSASTDLKEWLTTFELIVSLRKKDEVVMEQTVQSSETSAAVCDARCDLGPEAPHDSVDDDASAKSSTFWSGLHAWRICGLLILLLFLCVFLPSIVTAS